MTLEYYYTPVLRVAENGKAALSSGISPQKVGPTFEKSVFGAKPVSKLSVLQIKATNDV